MRREGEARGREIEKYEYKAGREKCTARDHQTKLDAVLLNQFFMLRQNPISVPHLTISPSLLQVLAGYYTQLPFIFVSSVSRTRSPGVVAPRTYIIHPIKDPNYICC